MLDIHRRDNTAAPSLPAIEFVRIQLAPLVDGPIFVSLTATTIDEEEPQLLDQEIVSRQVSSMDELLALIRAHVRIGAPESAPLPQQN